VRARLAGGLVGVVFGVTLSWTGMSSPEVLREALLLDNAYLYFFFAAAVATSTVGVWLLRRARVRALLTGEPVAWARERPRRNHLVGSLIFGVGWGVADACPGPIATQVGQGVAWSLFTIAGVAAGIVLAQRGAGASAGEGAGGQHVDALGSGRRGRDTASGAQAACGRRAGGAQLAALGDDPGVERRQVGAQRRRPPGVRARLDRVAARGAQDAPGIGQRLDQRAQFVVAHAGKPTWRRRPATAAGR
jgi:hypothetical protein